MGFQSAKCQLCENPKEVTAEDKHWLIHLAGHKDDIIRYVTSRFNYCPFCTNRKFYSKAEEEDHFRWFHSNKKIIKWYFDQYVSRKKIMSNT